MGKIAYLTYRETYTLSTHNLKRVTNRHYVCFQPLGVNFDDFDCGGIWIRYICHLRLSREWQRKSTVVSFFRCFKDNRVLIVFIAKGYLLGNVCWRKWRKLLNNAHKRVIRVPERLWEALRGSILREFVLVRGDSYLLFACCMLERECMERVLICREQKLTILTTRCALVRNRFWDPLEAIWADMCWVCYRLIRFIHYRWRCC
jgi:hypothetical protein